jgi:hypothetical protein
MDAGPGTSGKPRRHSQPSGRSTAVDFAAGTPINVINPDFLAEPTQPWLTTALLQPVSANVTEAIVISN